jgi:hypothetical protein
MTRPEDGIEIPAPFRHLRRFPLDGALLLFDRDSGLKVLQQYQAKANIELQEARPNEEDPLVFLRRTRRTVEE